MIIVKSVKVITVSLILLALVACQGCAGMGGSIRASNGPYGESYGVSVHGNTGGRQARGGQRFGYEPCASTANTMQSASVQDLEAWAKDGAVGGSKRTMNVRASDSPQRANASCTATISANSTSRTVDGEVVPPQRRDQRQQSGGQVFRAEDAQHYGDER